MSRIFLCLEGIFHVQNLSGLICPGFVQNFAYPEFVQNLSGFICLEFVQNFACPEFVRNMSGILHARNLSGFICPEFVQNFACLEFVQIYLSRMSGICPGFVWDFLCPEFVWTNSGHKKIPDISFDQNSGQIPDTPDIFRTFLVTFSGHFFFIGFLLDMVAPRYLYCYNNQ